MIGNPTWFCRRKYTGWGVTPCTWQGWAYVGVFIAMVGIVQLLPLADTVKIGATIGIAALLCIDVIDIMRKIKKDERETLHEAIAERNALWVMLAVLVTGVGYEAASSSVTGTITVNPVILIALGGAVIAKAVTNLYLDKKD